MAIGLAFRLLVIAHPTETLTARYRADDYFYYLRVAANVADGHGSSFDEGITKTNGYQPLFLWSLVGVFRLVSVRPTRLITGRGEK